jgi:hypothetical protein
MIKHIMKVLLFIMDHTNHCADFLDNHYRATSLFQLQMCTAITTSKAPKSQYQMYADMLMLHLLECKRDNDCPACGATAIVQIGDYQCIECNWSQSFDCSWPCGNLSCVYYHHDGCYPDDY